MARDIFTPGFKTEPYWLDNMTPADTGTPDFPASVDVLVVGAGYTGLSAAIETARGGRSTLVIDAEQAGWGCSSRNGGQISTSIKPSYDDLCRRYGKERGTAVAREGHEALTWIEAFVAREAIDCDFAVVGRFHAAHNAKQFEALAASIGKRPTGLEIPAEVVPRSEQHRELGTDAYWGGVVYPKHASLQPAKFHKGLVERTLAAGAVIVPFCPATRIERSGKSFTVSTGRGTVEARDVVIATNGYTGTVTPWQRRRVIPIGSYVIATEPIAPEVMDRLMPGQRIISDTRKVVYYYRPSPDRTRIVFGGRVSAGETDPTISGPRLHADLVALFPELRDVRVSHTWAGLVAFTFDTLAHTGVHDGMHYAMGYCGSGVSMAGYLGMRTGQKVLGLKEGRTGFDDVGFRTRPFYTGKPWFLSASVAYYRWRDRQSW
jgi:glycine/D-amino acid oxidase-like deaminating enzyme